MGIFKSFLKKLLTFLFLILTYGYGQVEFAESIITDEYGEPVFIVDFDYDGDNDIICKEPINNSDTDDDIVLLQNNGNQNFSVQIITNAAGGANEIYAADINDDGYMDVLATSREDWTPYNYKLKWYQNDGSGNFTTHEIANNLHYTYGISVDDIDGDGDKDIAIASTYMIWYENDGSENFTANTLSEEEYNVYSVLISDLDQDNDIDIIYGTIQIGSIWWENTGGGAFTDHTISSDQSYSVFSADINSDGHIDVISANYWTNEVCWYLNDGNQNFTGYTLDINDDSEYTLRNAIANDIDSDDDVDLISVSAERLVWYENDGQESFTPFTIVNSGGSDVFSLDFNNDGDKDIIKGISQWTPSITLYENNPPYSGPTWHVSTSGSDDNDGSEESPFATIQKGIDESSSGDTVLVAAGTYSENINYNGKNIVVGSFYLTTSDTSYISSTIIDGNQNGSVVTIESGEDSTAVLVGFTIQGGLATYGGGINPYNSNATFSNLIIQDNNATIAGGGIAFYYSRSKLIDTVIRNNHAEDDGGGINIAHGFVQVSNTLIESNTCTNDGAGVHIYNENHEIRNCTITGNSADRGGGIACGELSSCTLINVTISNNHADGQGGGILYEESRSNLTNVTISGNSTTTEGGGIASYGSALVIENSLLENNSSYDWGSAIYNFGNYDGDSLKITTTTISNNISLYPEGYPGAALFITETDYAEITNSIIWGNTPFDAYDSVSTVEVNYSNVNGRSDQYQEYNAWTEGSGNINSNPLFCGGDYTLAENSPCVGTGQNGANMGAFGVGCEAHIKILYVATTGSDDNDGSEENPFATINKALDVSFDGDTILVHPGTYYPVVDLGAEEWDDIRKSITIISTGGQDNTFLTLSEDQDYGMFRIQGGPENEIQVSLKGFTISKFTLYVYKANVSLENNLFTDSSMVYAIGHEAGDEIEWQLQITDCQFKNINHGSAALVLAENMYTSLTNVLFDSVGYCIENQGVDIWANNLNFEQIQGTAISADGMGGGNPINFYIENMYYQEDNSESESQIFDFGYDVYVEIDSLTFYSDRNAAAFEIHDNSSVELVNSEVRMVSGRWFDIRANSAINLNSTLLSGESTLAMIDSESYLNAYNSTIVSVDPYYLYADYPLIEYDHTLSFINLSGCYLSNTIVWSDNGYSIDFSNIENHAHYSIFTADDEDVENLQGLFNLDIDPFFCEDNTYNLAANSPAVGAGEDGVDIGAFGIGCDSLFFSPEIFLFYQNGDTLAANVQMVEDDTLYLNYLLLDQNLDESLELIWTNTTNVQISDDDSSDNIIEIIPAPDWNGVDTLNIIVSDGSLLDTATIHLEVVNVNDPPGMFSLLYPADGDTADISTTDSIMSFSWTKSHDIDQDTILYDFNLSLEFFNQTFGISQEMISDTFVVIDMEQLLPLFEFFDSDGITEMNWNVKAYDNEFSYQSPDNILNIIINVNDPPVIAAMPDTSMDEDSALSLELSATDVDGDYLSFSVDPIDNIEAYIFADGDSLMLVPDENWYGTADVTVRVSDGNGLEDSTSFTVTVNAVDDDPFSDGDLTDVYMYEDSDEPWEVNLNWIFTDIDGELTFSAELSDTTVIGVNLDVSMLSLYTLPDAYGETEMIVTASNPTRASVSDTVMVTVFAENDPPVLVVPDSIVMDEDQTFELMSMAELMDQGILTDIDNSIDDLSFELYTDNEQIHVEWDGDPSSNPLLVPVENYNGTGTLILCVNDGEYEVCGENSVTITPVNDAPFFAADMHAPVGLNLDFHVPVNVDDIDSDNLTVSFADGAVVPLWVSIDDNALHGMADTLGHFPLLLSLSDGDTAVTDTFHLHVENFIPEIISITDVPEDQGGWVYVEFTASYFDSPEETGQQYDIYRFDTFEDSAAWVMVTSGSAIYQDQYIFEVHTSGDSTSEDDGMTEFKVVASMNEGVFHSDPMMGYSTDDLAPEAPTGLLAAQTGTDITLNWDPLEETDDFNYFSIHRSESAEFETGAETLIGYSTELTYLDTTAEWFTTLYYRVNATDFAGNTGPASDAAEGYVHVNLAPVMSEIEAQSMDEDQSFEMVVSATDENEADMLTYGALSSVDDVMATVSNDTLSIGLTENWFGTADLMVYVTDGELSDTTSFTLTVNAVNDAPTVFGLISPEDSTQITITSADLMQELDLVVSWEPSTDVDNDDLSYGFVLYNGPYGADVLIDTLLTETVLNIPYQSIAELIGFMGLTSISGDWTVFATDGVDTTQSGDVWNITLDASDVLSVDGEILPTVFALHQNYPNPFNPTTKIRYDLPEDALVSITIYDIMGRSIRSLVNSQQTAGYRSIQWNATNNLGEPVSAGMYIYMIQAGEFRQVKKMVLLK